MTNEETAAGALSAGIDLPATDGALNVSNITAMINEIEAHIDLHDIGETASHWLANAKSALRSALQYVEQHFEAVVTKAKAEVAEIEAKVESAIETVKSEGSDTAASIVAATAASVR